MKDAFRGKRKKKKGSKQLISEEEQRNEDQYKIKEERQPDKITKEKPIREENKYKEASIVEIESKKSRNNNELSQKYYLDKELFIVNIKKNESSLLITCEPKDELISIYHYSIEISYEDFLKLGKSFKLCDNIDDIFNLIKNIINQVQLYTNDNEYDNRLKDTMKAYSELKYFDNDSIKLFFKVPLLNGKYEEIDVKFKKEKKDILEQFNKIKEKYLKIEFIIYCKWMKDDSEIINEIKAELEK